MKNAHLVTTSLESIQFGLNDWVKLRGHKYGLKQTKMYAFRYGFKMNINGYMVRPQPSIMLEFPKMRFIDDNGHDIITGLN